MQKNWGLSLIRRTGNKAHLKKLVAVSGSLTSLETKSSFPTERSFYDSFGIAFVEPELREGLEEVRQARRGTLPTLITEKDIQGDLHMHTEASDGSNSIEQMVAAAEHAGYAYIGISDHSQSLEIAGGVSEEKLWAQIRKIDQLNERLNGIRVLKSAEVDILADGTLDYSDELLRELDYTVCSIHSRFAFGKEKQTERIIRAMGNKFFTIMGHATGRLLLKRSGYEIDMERIAAHARQTGCFLRSTQVQTPEPFSRKRESCSGARRTYRHFHRCTQHSRIWDYPLRDRTGQEGRPRRNFCIKLPAFRKANQAFQEIVSQSQL